MVEKKDSKLKSLTESLSNIAVGYPINHLSNMIILVPFAALLVNTAKSHGIFSAEYQGVLVMIGVLYTVVSVVRSYCLRRLFERFGQNENGYTLMLRLYKRIKLRSLK